MCERTRDLSSYLAIWPYLTRWVEDGQVVCERTRELSSSGRGGQSVLLGPSGLEEHIACSDWTNLVRPKHKTDS